MRERGGLKIGDTLGTHFSTNRVFGTFVVGTTKPVQSIVRPINTCQVSTKLDGLHIKVEDSAIPEMFAAIASTTLGVLDNAAPRESLKFKL